MLLDLGTSRHSKPTWSTNRSSYPTYVHRAPGHPCHPNSTRQLVRVNESHPNERVKRVWPGNYPARAPASERALPRSTDPPHSLWITLLPQYNAVDNRRVKYRFPQGRWVKASRPECFVPGNCIPLIDEQREKRTYFPVAFPTVFPIAAIWTESRTGGYRVGWCHRAPVAWWGD